MALSQKLITQFAKLVDNVDKKDKGETIRGTYQKIGEIEYVRLDGSDILTPVSSTVEAKNGERVQVLIKDHFATITGNISSPSARSKSVQDLADTVDEYGNTIQQMDNTIIQQGNSIVQMNNTINQHDTTINQHDTLINQQGDKIISIDNTVIAQGNSIEANHNSIIAQGNQIDSMNNTITEHGNNITSINNTVSAQGNQISQQANIIQQQGNTITQQGNTINEVNSDVTILNSGFTIRDGVITGLSGAVIDSLKTNTLNAEYATITFSNIQMAAIQKLFTDSGIIKDLVVSQGKITGELVGVTIKGDLIEGNSIIADKLVVKGDDGIYYKLNIDGLNNISTSESGKFVLLQNEPENWSTNYKDYYIISSGNYVHVTGDSVPTWSANTYYKLSSTYENALDGSNIVAHSIVAEKIAVDDLVAFGATIGGFDIDTHSLHTHLKNAIDSSISGMFMDDTGQVVFGDDTNYVKYYKDETDDNKWKLDIMANEISMGTSGKTIAEELDKTREDITSEISSATQTVQNNVDSLNNHFDDKVLDILRNTRSSDFVLTTSQPSNWTATFSDYYIKVGAEYVRATGIIDETTGEEIAPTWTADTYYRNNTSILELVQTISDGRFDLKWSTDATQTQLRDSIASILGSDKIETLRYISASNGAMIFGDKNSLYKLLIDNDGIDILYNNNRMSFWDSEKFDVASLSMGSKNGIWQEFQYDIFVKNVVSDPIPMWITNKYYSASETPTSIDSEYPNGYKGTFSLTTSEPSDWSTTYTNYYVKVATKYKYYRFMYIPNTNGSLSFRRVETYVIEEVIE